MRVRFIKNFSVKFSEGPIYFVLCRTVWRGQAMQGNDTFALDWMPMLRVNHAPCIHFFSFVCCIINFKVCHSATDLYCNEVVDNFK